MNAPADFILRQPEVEERLGVSRSTIWVWRKAGLFPAPLRLGKVTIGWRASTVEAWLNSREIAT